MKLPPLNALRVFDAAARHQAFGKAAEELHVTHGAVSRQVRLLEESLGLALFERRNRGVFLTDQGRQLHELTGTLFEQLSAGLARLRQPAGDAPLVLSCEPTIAMMWLIPRLPDFQRRHPGAQVHLYAAGGPLDFAAQGVDVALRRNDFEWDAALHAERVCDEWTGPACRPGLVGAVSAGADEDDWGGAPALGSATRPQAWRQWSLAAGRKPPRRAGPVYEHFYLSLQAAAAGLGVAIGSALMACDALRDRRLEAPRGFTRDGSAYFLLSPRPCAEDPRAAAFLEWLREEAAASLREAAAWPARDQSVAS
ncbi:LysR substrate-binding domain-containing protein [Achromobacter denitrificans]|uniref:LysR substrate-binding domain-containing protein n=1 Tax=Achromobacter denitrificans TaxID=32002 RepID=UPI000788575D|nr:LysR substrate-binding domain-containing protein [Achromobacter denitrificans]MBV2160165.1 LysR family transcriptional regulator [Achromobacter denitrificans]MDF3943603.1 LysR substrate-binding domain-containing protein [Achromobacter denitrificans]OLU08498.1 LysR family transcriptional regulator [Achromobacter denitrificans]QKH43907.1 LysR family transcriptional regulator [Achromobacter denitrificans]QKH48952.1 LysR family transcriptional regulator [Achromobacter denitrificans]